MRQTNKIAELRAELGGYTVLLTAIRLKRLLFKANFNPAQLRDAIGRWTTGDSTEVPTPAGGGYPVDILEEDVLGGHTFERHVNKPEEYLKTRILGSRRNIPFIVSTGEKRAGSFTSLEAANKLVNSALSQNQQGIRPLCRAVFHFCCLSCTFTPIMTRRPDMRLMHRTTVPSPECEQRMG